MSRQNGTKTSGGAFTHEEKSAVWNKAKIVSGNDKDVFRQDICGAWIKWGDHGDTSSKYGWEIDHVKPVSAGGTDDISNLQPLHWQNNRSKSDTTNNDWACIVDSSKQ